jgi:hypothetical protein
MASDLDRARALKAHFERAAAVEQKNLERLQGQKAMADRQKDPPGRTTSAAKHYDPDALSRAKAAKEQFQRAAAGQQKEANKAADKTRDQQTKQTRHVPSPGMHLQPKNPAQRDGPNRQTFEKNEGKLQHDELGKSLRKKHEFEQRQLQQRQTDRDKGGDDRSR